jgi:hypothetical protein
MAGGGRDVISLLAIAVLATLAAVYWRRKQCGALARGALLLSLAAMGARFLGGHLGSWAEGALDVAIMLLIAIVLPVWICVYSPTWFAWRVLQPFGLRPAVLAAFWLSALVQRRDIPSIRIFLGAVRDVPFPPAREVTADAWTAIAAAVQADRQHAHARVDAIVEALVHLPSETRFPMLARQYGVEVLARSAASRRDWAAVLRITRNPLVQPDSRPDLELGLPRMERTERAVRLGHVHRVRLDSRPSRRAGGSARGGYQSRECPRGSYRRVTVRPLNMLRIWARMGGMPSTEAR